MKKLTLCLLILYAQLGFGESRPGFSGCGDYVLKGVVVKNTIATIKNSPVIYKINPKTTSEMHFSFSSAQDLSLVSPYLDVPTTLKVRINKKMDGTNGEIAEVNGVSIRKPNPLEPHSDSGIFLQASRGCQ